MILSGIAVALSTSPLIFVPANSYCLHTGNKIKETPFYISVCIKTKNKKNFPFHFFSVFKKVIYNKYRKSGKDAGKLIKNEN